MSAPTAPGYRHHALLYGSADQLVDTAVPFLADGLAAGELAVLTCRPEHNTRLAAALGPGDRVLTLANEGIYLRIADAAATYRRLVRQHVAAGIPRVRLVGEVRFDNSPQSWAEWTRYEAICNVVLGPLPLSSVCAYDTRDLPAPMRRGVEQTHPALLTPTGRRTNASYLPPADILRRTAPADLVPLPATPATAHLAALTGAAQLADARAQLRRALGLTTRYEPLRADFLTAAAEVIGNALRHGRPPVDVRLWITPTRLLCAVTDRGDGFDDPLAGYVPYDDDHARAGLWLVRRTCDSLVYVATAEGFTARFATELPAPDHRMIRPGGPERRRGEEWTRRPADPPPPPERSYSHDTRTCNAPFPDPPPSTPESEEAPDPRTRLREAEERTEHLQRALASNRRIGMAIGILMRERLCTEERAFDALRHANMQRNAKLRDIAERVIDTGTL